MVLYNAIYLFFDPMYLCFGPIYFDIHFIVGKYEKECKTLIFHAKYKKLINFNFSDLVTRRVEEPFQEVSSKLLRVIKTKECRNEMFVRTIYFLLAQYWTTYLIYLLLISKY